MRFPESPRIGLYLDDRAEASLLVSRVWPALKQAFPQSKLSIIQSSEAVLSRTKLDSFKEKDYIDTGITIPVDESVSDFSKRLKELNFHISINLSASTVFDKAARVANIPLRLDGGKPFEAWYTKDADSRQPHYLQWIDHIMEPLALDPAYLPSSFIKPPFWIHTPRTTTEKIAWLP